MLTYLLLEPLQFGTVDAALEVQYRVRSESQTQQRGETR